MERVGVLLEAYHVVLRDTALGVNRILIEFLTLIVFKALAVLHGLGGDSLHIEGTSTPSDVATPRRVLTQVHREFIGGQSASVVPIFAINLIRIKNGRIAIPRGRSKGLITGESLPSLRDFNLIRRGKTLKLPEVRRILM